MSDVSISLFADTHVGMRRAANEDSFLIADLTRSENDNGAELIAHSLGDNGYLMAVSDGMGGAAAGEVASELAVRTLFEELTKPLACESLAEHLQIATEIANERIWNYAQQNPELLGMGATLTAVLVKDNIAHIAQVGDSRAYLIRNGNAEQLTRDQSLVQALLDSDMIQPDQAHLIPQNVILQALGTQPAVSVVMTEMELCQGDLLLVCSDGLSNKIRDEEMPRVIGETDNLKAAGTRFIEVANERGGEDNITVIVAAFSGADLKATTQTKRITGSYNAFEKTISYEEAAFIASRYVPPNGQDDEASDEEHRAPVTGVLRMPASLAAEAENADGQGEYITDATQAREFFERQRTANERRNLTMWIIALVLLLLLAVAGYFFVKPRFEKHNDSERPTENLNRSPSHSLLHS
ncbi:MAG: PP2C family serine/threonine-protein phosphatase [Acidobacteriota bacterium]